MGGGVQRPWLSDCHTVGIKSTVATFDMTPCLTKLWQLFKRFDILKDPSLFLRGKK